MGGYVVGAACGLAFGLLVGFGKFAALWKKILTTNKEITMGTLYLRMGIGYLINVIALVIVFFLRDTIPFNFVTTIVATAVGLSLSAKIAPTNKVFDNVKENAS